MRRQALNYSLAILSIIFSFLSWQRVEIGINSASPSGYFLPVFFFTLFFVSFYLATVMIKEKYILNFLALFCLFSSFVFVFNPWHIISTFLGWILAWIGIYRIRRDMGLNIRISLAKTLTTGNRFIVLAFCIVLASQYFFTIQNKNFEELLPNFSNNKYSGILVSKILSVVNPEYKKISSEETTIDEFIIETQKKQLEEKGSALLPNEQIESSINQIGENISEEQKEEIKNKLKDSLGNANIRIMEENEKLILEESRKKFEDLSGKKLTGQEKMSEVFEAIINQKITSYFKPEINSKTNPSLLQTILTIILFLTIVSLGSFLNIFWVLFCKFVFWILVKCKVITINKVPALVEIME